MARIWIAKEKASVRIIIVIIIIQIPESNLVGLNRNVKKVLLSKPY